MTILSAPSSTFDAAAVREAVEAVVYGFLDEQERAAPDLLPELAVFTGLLRELLAAGGKRIRPLLCVAGWHAVTDDPSPAVLWRAAASLELFHAFALIHDDVMDRSDTRRGRPTAHRRFAALHPGHPRAEELGTGAAILLGDLALGWSYELLHTPTATRDQLDALWPVLNAMRTETLTGQYLDLIATGSPTAETDTAWRIIRYKTAKYTIERPLHLGATLAGATPGQLQALSAYALPLGEAFQLRDDLLGVYGNPDRTGKPTSDDLREGKHTVLVATALRHSSPAQQRTLHELLGDPRLDRERADEARTILTATGARAETEHMLADRCRQALAVLDAAPLQPAATAALRRWAIALTHSDT